MSLPANIQRSDFGTLPDGRPVSCYRITNASGIELRVTDYGGIILSLKTPDRQGRFDDIVLGFDSLADYLSPAYRQANPYFGALIGRYANRIGGAEFSLEGQRYRLASNDGANSLHGGDPGFDRCLWQADTFVEARGSGLILSRVSDDGEAGYPGRLSVRVRYLLGDDDSLKIAYHAETTRATPVNLTQHSYFNLRGEGSGDVLDHRLMLAASAFTPVDEQLIPRGEIAPVAGTPFDFTTPTAIGARLAQHHPQLVRAGGYDHNFVLDGDEADNQGLRVAAQVIEAESGRVLEVATSEPGIQFYAGNALDGTLRGKAGQPYRRHAGLALETQHFPDSPHQPAFPGTILQPGEVYRSRTRYRFSCLAASD
ncbi:aldose epimerase family protein [Salinicola sp. RZ23]|uniref:aldose epimerase family protein n=1 Tax=Salinicola sp. RZ23 TaxID=1949087 RepID=UPI000DA21AC8|nr:aldose epimerase family protein [Salinicola sp. RZ23]